jgi:LPLT family lysophospholipid transporter-like MFS transporter
VSVVPHVKSQKLWTRGMVAVLISQFLSALADNALLFAALALLKIDHYAEWTQPVMQEFFVAAYIVLAPFAGPLADCLPKGRAMLIANGLKFVGALGICLGLNPFFAYGFVGIGAAAYSPAKYGILPELTTTEQLVKANSLIESSTIAAILVGAIAGGTLADWNVQGALWVVAACYALAAVTNLAVPKLAPLHRFGRLSILEVLRDFARACRTLIAVRDARFSITGTCLFWGIGSTMRFLLIAWVPIALGIFNNRTPAYLNAMTAVGIVLGAALAGRFVSVSNAYRALPSGVLIGVAVCLMALVHSLPAAFVVLALVGAAGGFFVVPLNALLQERGQNTVGTGHAIAIQNLGENTTMLVMIGIYALLVRSGVRIDSIALVFGVAFSLAIAGLWIYNGRRLNSATTLSRRTSA